MMTSSEMAARPCIVDASAMVLANPSGFNSPEHFLDLFKVSGTLTEVILKELPQITDFHFYFFGKSNRANRLQSVSILDVSFCPNLGDIGIFWITTLFPNLKKLDVTGCPLVTERSLVVVSSKCQSLESAKFDMTGVRFLPTSVKDPSKFSLNCCPLVSAIASEKPTETSSNWLKAKIVILKTVSMMDSSVATRLFNEPVHVVGSDAAGCTMYRYKSFTVVECVEDGANQLLLSENCLLILPYDGTITVNQQFYSVKNRLRYVASLVTRFKAVCLPLLDAPQKDARRSKKFKNLKEIILESLESTQAPSNDRTARHRLVLTNDFKDLADKTELTAWLDANNAFDDFSGLPQSLFETAVNCLNDLHFCTVETFIKTMQALTETDSTLNAKLPRCWSSFVSLLAETGNCWLEKFTGYDNALPGPNHVMAPMSDFVNFVSEFRSAHDTTAMAEDVRCLVPATPLCSIAHVHLLLKTKEGNQLPQDAINRLLVGFEFSGLGIFRRKTALAMTPFNKNNDPPVPVSHFVTEYDECSRNKPPFIMIVKYPVVTYPVFVVRNLIAVLSRVLNPSLIWGSGAFFYEAFFLEVLVTADMEGFVKVQFTTDGLVSRPEIRQAVEASRSVIHTICCLVLNPFALEDLFSAIQINGLKFLTPGKTDHSFSGVNGTIRAFSRVFDETLPRCSNCLLDFQLVALMERLHVGTQPSKSRLLLRKTNTKNSTNDDKTMTFRLLLNDPSSSLPLHGKSVLGLPTVDAQLFYPDGLESLKICPDCLEDSYANIEVVHNSSGSIHFSVSPAGGANKPDAIKQLLEIKKVINKEMPLSIEASRSNDNSGVNVTISVGGNKVSETLLKASRAKYLSIQAKFKPDFDGPMTVPLFTRSVSVDQQEVVDIGDFASQGGVKPGMRLEARNLRYPHMICAANIKSFEKEKNEYLIHFDGWSDGYSHWAKLDSLDIFPCGFVEFLNQNPGKLAAFKSSTGFSGLLRTPRGSGFEESSKAFNWHIYFSDLFEQLKIVVNPIPFEMFEKSHLLGFPRDFLWLKQFRIVQDPPTLGSLCSQNYGDLMETVNKSYRVRDFMHAFLPFVPLPELSWELCVWPSRERLLEAGSTSSINMICGFPGMHHFVNTAPTVLNSSPMNTTPAVAELIAIMLVRMISQPRMIPDKHDALFPKIQSACPFNFSSLDKENRTEVIENCLREGIFPCLLDYMLLCLRDGATTPDAAKPQNVNPNALAEQKSIVTKAAASRSLVESIKVAHLVSMSQDEFFICNERCPRLMCIQHSAHFVRYMEALADNYQPVALTEKGASAKAHTSLLTQCLLTSDEVLALKSVSIATIHPHLTELYLGHCKLPSLLTGVSDLRSLTELILVDNQISQLPSEFAQLAPTLRSLDISDNKFETLPDVVFSLKELVSLRANHMHLSSLDPAIGALTKLRVLSLNSNGFPSLPKELYSLTDLEVLDLSGTPLPSGDSLYYDNVSAFCRYHRISMLVLTTFTNWTSASGSRKGFVQSYLDSDGVERLRQHFFQHVLRLSFPETGFPLEILNNMKKLRELSLAYQPITLVPDEIGQLQQLACLDLTGCLKLESISARVAIDSLETLLIDGCSSLKTPPQEITKRGTEATMAYFRRLASGSVSCRRCKLMFVGLGGAGKTTLSKALTKPGTLDFSRGEVEITDGIDISEWHASIDNTSPGVDFRLWDFAGQVVYYNTHQFFLSSRAVYLVIWNMRLGYQHAGLDFWLSSIACHAPHAPVLIVGTQADLVSQERSLLPELSLRERFGSIRGFHYISNRTGVGITELRKQIIEVALTQKHMGEHIPKVWLSFEENLLKARSSNPSKNSTTTGDKSANSVLMFNETKRIADASGIFEDDEIFEALQFLSDLGSIQFFRNEFLCDRVIINPQWIVDVMACVVSVKNSPIKDGRLQHADISRLWSAYPVQLHQWLLKLTEAFDLTFPLRNAPASIVPCLLPEDAPASFAWHDFDISSSTNQNLRQMQLSFVFRYLPTGLFNRVQVRLCQFSDDAVMWRVGSLLKKNEHMALLMQTDSTHVQVKVQGPRPENLSFLILEVVDTLINEAFHGVKPDYLFSCPECVGARVSEPSMFERSKIRRATELHVPFLQCSEYFHCIPTPELRQLLPAESAVDFDCQLVRTVKQLSGLSESLQNDVLVIGCPSDCGSKKGDLISLNEFSQDLQTSLKTEKLQTTVILDPESIPFDRLTSVLRSSSLVLCCVSPAFMASERCQAALFCARETYKKLVLITFLVEFDWKSNSSLAFLLGSEVFIKATSRSKYQPGHVLETVKLRLQQAKTIAASSPTARRYPPVFLSYCWQNSREAVDKGTRLTQGAVGATDPRALKKFFDEQSIDCWIDIEQVGRGALFEHIALGLRHARVVVVCISDEYCESENCLREFRFATSACQLPVVLCAVGTGCLWRQSEVTLVASLSARINFQTDSKENYDALLTAVKQHLSSEDFVSKGAKSQPKIPVQPDAGQNQTSTTVSNQDALIFYGEMLELAQRRFIRQLGAIGSNSKSFPRLSILDLVPKDGKPDKELENLENVEDSIDKFEWCVRFFCEHEAGWHLTGSKMPVAVGGGDGEATTSASEVLRQSGAYLSRVLSLVRHSNTELPQLLAPNDASLVTFCRGIVSMLEKMVKFEEPFANDYTQFRNFVISLDDKSLFGGLQYCQLAVGKGLWLCEDHSKSTQYRPKEAPTNKTTKENNNSTVVEEEEETKAESSRDKFYSKSNAVKRMVAPGEAGNEINEADFESTNDNYIVDPSRLKRPLTSVKTSRACLIQ